MKNQLIIDTPPGIIFSSAEADPMADPDYPHSTSSEPNPKEILQRPRSYSSSGIPQAWHLRPCQTMRRTIQCPRIRAGWRLCKPIASTSQVRTGTNAARAYAS
jgi:hypothetical protein